MTDIRAYFEKFTPEYFNKISEVMKKIDYDSINKVTEILYDAKEKEKNIFFFGNGGSMSIATHFACDLGKGIKQKNSKKFYKAISLDNIAWLTAQANDGEQYFNDKKIIGKYDHGYDGIFVGQLENFLKSGDVAFGISSSGNSLNVLNALKYAKEKNATTIAMVGFDGGEALKIANYSILVPTPKGEYGLVEGIHELIHHLIYEGLKSMEKN